MHRLFLVVAALVASTASAANITTTTCTPTVQTGCVSIPLASYTNVGSVSVQVTGTWTGTLVFEGSNDASTYVLLRAYPVPDHDVETVYVTSTTGNGAWSVDPAGLIYFRVRATSLTSGTAVVSVQPTSALPTTGAVALNRPDGGVYMTLGAQRVAVEATGPAGEPVTITGTNAFYTALGPDKCKVAPIPRLGLTTTPIVVPPDLADGGSGALASRTSIILTNVSRAGIGGGPQDIACDQLNEDGGYPDCAVPGWGKTLLSNGGTWETNVGPEVRIYCRACSGSNIPLEGDQLSCVKAFE